MRKEIAKNVLALFNRNLASSFEQHAEGYEMVGLAGVAMTDFHRSMSHQKHYLLLSKSP